jgi:hypothetical protein
VLIAIEIGDAFAPVERAWFVKSAIEGFALGCLPAFRRWNLPPLYQSGVRFRLPEEHGSGVERMQTPLDTFNAGWGDCDRLLIWWLCERWAQRQAARCSTIFLGGNMHVLGRKSWDESGPLEDPSMVLGAAVPPGWPPNVNLIRARQLL